MLLVSALLSGCGFAGLLAPVAVSAAIGVGEVAGSAAYDAGRQSAAEAGLASRTFAYPLLVMDEEVLPSVAKSRGWKVDSGSSPSCRVAVVVSRPVAPSPSGSPGVRVQCFYVGGPFPSFAHPSPSTVVVVSSVEPGDDEAVRTFGVEILDALGDYLASVRPQTVDKVFDQDVAAVRATIAKLSEGWTRRIDILHRDTASDRYRVEYRTPRGGRSVTMHITLAGVGSRTAVTVVGDGSQSEGAFRSDARWFLQDLSTALAK